MTLAHPIMVGSSPLADDLDMVRRLEDAGMAAIVMRSLFEEQIAHDELAMAEVHEFGTDSFAESLSFFPEQEDYRTGPEAYLKTLEDAKSALSVPVINIGPWGKDLHKFTERVYELDLCERTPTLLESAIDYLLGEL